MRIEGLIAPRVVSLSTVLFFFFRSDCFGGDAKSRDFVGFVVSCVVGQECLEFGKGMLMNRCSIKWFNKICPIKSSSTFSKLRAARHSTILNVERQLSESIDCE